MRSKISMLFLAAFVSMLPRLSHAYSWSLGNAPTNGQWFSIAVSPRGDKMAVGDSSGRNGVWVSDSDGFIWHQSGAPTNGGWASLAFSLNGGMLAAADNSGTYGIYISLNLGTNWTQSAAPVSDWQSVACAGDGLHFLAADSATLYTTTNPMAAWIPRTNSLPTNANWHGVAYSANGAVLAAVDNKLGRGGIWISTNAGTNWTLATTAPTNGSWQAVATSADGTRLVADGNGAGVWMSTNSGATWFPTTAPNIGWFSTASSIDGSRLIACSDSGIYTSTNSGKLWVKETNAPVAGQWQSVGSSADGGVLGAAMSGGGVYNSVNALPPHLTIARSGTNAVLSWPVTVFSFSLQRTNVLPATNTWQILTNQPSLNSSNLQYQITVPLPAISNNFYRLFSSPA